MAGRRFSYEGDHAEVVSYGHRFPQGVPVEVEDAFLLKKLEGNNHFKEHGAEVETRAYSDGTQATAPLPEASPARRRPGRRRKDA